MICISNATI